MATAHSSKNSLWRFSIKQHLKASLVIGIVFGIMLAIQGIGYAATYPTDAERAAFASTLAGAPSLGLLYGEPIGMQTTTGYMVYRGVAVLALIGSIWGILTATKMLRGSEEDGRWESIVSGSTTQRSATLLMTLGMYTTLLLGFFIASGVTLLVNTYPGISLSVPDSLLVNLAVFLPIAFAMAAGVLVSQLAITRRRALLYALIPFITFFLLRSIGNILPEWYWLKNWTPFGWSDQLRPIIDLHSAWLLPLIIIPTVTAIIGVYLAGKRDLGESLIRESEQVKPHFHLLQSSWQLTLRLNIGVILGWITGLVIMSGIFASVAGLAADAVAESPALSQSIIQLTGGDNSKLKTAFLGAFAIFTAAALMIMAAVGVASIRRDEAKQYADAILVQPVSRARWLIQRVMIIASSVTLACILPNIVVYIIAKSQNIDVDTIMIIDNLQMLGAIAFVLSIGVFFYGLLPRLASASMYLVIAWSFVVDLLASIFQLSDIFKNSSLYHYISLVPASSPDWKAFAWLIAISLILTGIGVWRFAKRDIITE